MPDQEKQVFHTFDPVDIEKRDYLEEGETQDQYKYHLDEKDFIITQLH